MSDFFQHSWAAFHPKMSQEESKDLVFSDLSLTYSIIPLFFFYSSNQPNFEEPFIIYPRWLVLSWCHYLEMIPGTPETQDEMGPIQSSISNSFNFEVINSLDIGQREPIHITDPYSIFLFCPEL